MKSVELFAGAGGLALGISEAGFHHEAVLEFNPHACRTIRTNKARGVRHVKDWTLHQVDVRRFDYDGIAPDVDLLSGGPPCQPFSLGGKHRAHNDHRDMFPEAVRAIRGLRPRAILLENVKGLLRQSFTKYCEYIRLQITYPELARAGEEEWEQHLARLEQHHTHGKHEGLCYRVIFRLLNAADYGIPQRRERVIIVGFRSDVEREWTYPAATHSEDALLWEQWVTGEYWERHRVANKDRPELSARSAARVERLRSEGLLPLRAPWRTVRDSLSDLPDPRHVVAGRAMWNHQFNPGARTYPGHTGSPLDEPAKTLKAGDHGVPGGENIVAYPDGSVRYFTVRESARLQGFPDDYVFEGSWTEAMRQLGNAVPVGLATAVATDMAACLSL